MSGSLIQDTPGRRPDTTALPMSPVSNPATEKSMVLHQDTLKPRAMWWPGNYRFLMYTHFGLMALCLYLSRANMSIKKRPKK